MYLCSFLVSALGSLIPSVILRIAIAHTHYFPRSAPSPPSSTPPFQQVWKVAVRLSWAKPSPVQIGNHTHTHADTHTRTTCHCENFEVWLWVWSSVQCGYNAIARRLTHALRGYLMVSCKCRWCCSTTATLNYVHSFCRVCVSVCVYLNCWPKEGGWRRSSRRQAEPSNGFKQMAKFKRG